MWNSTSTSKHCWQHTALKPACRWDVQSLRTTGDKICHACAAQPGSRPLTRPPSASATSQPLHRHHQEAFLSHDAAAPHTPVWQRVVHSTEAGVALIIQAAAAVKPACTQTVQSHRTTWDNICCARAVRRPLTHPPSTSANSQPLHQTCTHIQ
jgi:hypothetical protein